MSVLPLAQRNSSFFNPGFKVACCDFDKLAQVQADKRIEIRAQLKGAVLQQPENLGLFHQGLRDQVKGARQQRLARRGLQLIPVSRSPRRCNCLSPDFITAK